MKVGRGELERLLRLNVLEIRFTRRHIKRGRPETRRMLCTNSLQFLTIPQWKVVLNYYNPSSMPKFDPRKLNVIVTWDILMQNFRLIPCEDVELLQRFDASDAGFGKVFNEIFYSMKTDQKLKWMDS